MVIENINPNKLHDELIKNGVVPTVVKHDAVEGDYLAKKTWITFENGEDMDLVDKIIRKHNPTPEPPEPTEFERQQEIINTLGQELSMLKLQIMMGEI